MLRFIAYAVPLLILLLALFGFTVELLDVEPRKGSVIRLALFEQPLVPGQLVLGTWLVEASGLIALFLLAQGRFGAWWLDGLAAGWVAWIFRGPLLVITIVVAARQPQDPWWTLAFGWWVLYSVCGLSLAVLARRSGLGSWVTASDKAEVESDDVPNGAQVESASQNSAEIEDKVEEGELPAAEPEEAAEPEQAAESEEGTESEAAAESESAVESEVAEPESAPEEPVAEMSRSSASAGTTGPTGDTKE